MKDKLILVLAFVLACILVCWGYRKREATPRQNIPLSQNQNVSSQIQATSESIQPAQNNSIFHLYSPLRDSPPAPTPDQIEMWSESLNAMLLKGMTPDFSGPPLASIFHLEATKAKGGDTKAAMTLFKELLYCMATPLKSQQDVEAKIRLMTDTHTDADGNQSDDLDAAITEVNRRYSYCSGLTEAQRKSISHWGWMTAQSGDAVAQAWAAAYPPPPTAYDSVTIQKYKAQLRHMIDTAANVGVPEAWVELEQGYLTGACGYQVDPVKAYASLYTEYMLTDSDYLAYQIWKQSQTLSSRQLQEGEQLAQEFYKRIKQ